jgi:hypothetical protein
LFVFTNRERDFCLKDGAFNAIASACRLRDGFAPKFDVLLTSYEMISVDKATLGSIPYSVLVIDEAHRLKRQQSLVSLKYIILLKIKSFKLFRKAGNFIYVLVQCRQHM